MGIKTEVEISGCSECGKHYLYTTEGSFCKHPKVRALLGGKNGLISNGFVDNKFPVWCPLQNENLEKHLK